MGQEAAAWEFPASAGEPSCCPCPGRFLQVVAEGTGSAGSALQPAMGSAIYGKRQLLGHTLSVVSVLLLPAGSLV